MAKTIALIASLDTKKKETLYAASVIQKQGFSTYIIDISTKNLVDGADITPVEILKRYGIEWEDFDPLGKAASIDVMSKSKVLPTSRALLSAERLQPLYFRSCMQKENLMLSFLLEADRTQKWRQWQ